MGKTIILNLRDIKLTGDVLDIGESYGVIYNISKDAIDEVSVDLLEGSIDEESTNGGYDTCTVFFYLSSIWREASKVNLIKEASKLVKVGGEICIWDINKEIVEVFNNKTNKLYHCFYIVLVNLQFLTMSCCIPKYFR